MERTNIDIVVCTDRWFVMPTGVMIYSVCVNNPEVNIVFHVIVDADVTPKDKHDLEEAVSAFSGKTIIFYDPNQQMQSFAYPPLTLTGITKTTYYRLYVAELLSSDMEKVLYLDADIIVRHSLLPLWNIDIAGYAIAAVPDVSSDVPEIYNRLQIPRSFCYVNAGVLLINLSYWRDHSVADLCQKWMLEHYDDIRFGDQDILNAVLKEKILLLPQKYNLLHGYLCKQTYYDYKKYKNNVLEARRDPVIVHFSAGKPWDVYGDGKLHPFVSTFFKYQSQTKWKGLRIDRRPLKLKICNFVADTLRKMGLKKVRKAYFEFMDIAPVD